MTESKHLINAAVVCANPSCRAVEVILDAPHRRNEINKILRKRGWFAWVELAWCPKHCAYMRTLKSKGRYMVMEYEAMDAHEELERAWPRKEAWANAALDALDEEDEP